MKRLKVGAFSAAAALCVFQCTTAQGTCNTNADCTGGALCDPSAHVCVGGGGDGGPRDSGSADAGSDAGIDAGLPTIDTFCASYFAAYCAWFTRCGYMASSATCLALTLGEIPPSACVFPDQQAVKHGRATFDAASAAACFNALSTTAACGQDPSTDSACAGFINIFLVGSVADGNPCYLSSECAATSYCTARTTSTCPGVCTPRSGLGAAVTYTEQCLAPFYDYNGHCSTLVPDQGSCAPDGGATFNQTCVSSDFCNGTQVCAQPLTAGQSCATNQCLFPLFCNTSSICEAPQPVGSDCSALGLCQLDLTCLPALPDGGGGKTCMTRGASNPCLSDQDCPAQYWCSGYITGSKFGNCIAAGAAGVGCTLQDQCKYPLFCDSTGHCAQQVGYGAVCDLNAKSGSSCVYGQGLDCTAGDAGGTCTHSGSCLDLAP
jgi:hypothetical protein